MKRRELTDDIIDDDATLSRQVDLLDRFKVGEYFEVPFNVYDNPQDTTAMVKYVDQLKQAGLDIGKGDAQFGYKMPIPEKYTGFRNLQIFRRR